MVVMLMFKDLVGKLPILLSALNPFPTESHWIYLTMQSTHNEWRKYFWVSRVLEVC